MVIDLPSEERNELYQEDTAHAVTQTKLGPVRYRYHSMVDLSDYADGSVDLVYSGQSIEHVPFDVADVVLAEVRRVLRPGGHLALDTPNARVTRLQQAAFIDPDHEHEYTHDRAALEAGTAPGSRSWRPRGSTTPARAWPPAVSTWTPCHRPRIVQRDRGLLPPGLRVPGTRLTDQPRESEVSMKQHEIGAGERTRTSTPSGDRDLNPARLPIPPRPQRPATTECRG